MTDPDFRIRSLFDTPAKCWAAARDFGAGLLLSGVAILYLWAVP